ncbi:MAG: phosphoglycerate mutase [Hyphomicrobiales bacterium]|nr:phosphoglycerate mutase [Hyphomicrobiales bacterium]
MRRLILLRHAKALPTSPEGDRARVLAERGRADAERAGKWLRAHAIAPDMALVSDSARTRETAEIVLRELGRVPHVRVDPKLYHAEPWGLLRAIRSAPQGCRTVLLIGHNPGVAELAEALAGGGERDALRLMEAGFPTAAMAVFTFDHEWTELGEQTGRLERFVTARSLREAAAPD